jgi:hypothetical protein
MTKVGSGVRVVSFVAMLLLGACGSRAANRSGTGGGLGSGGGGGAAAGTGGKMGTGGSGTGGVATGSGGATDGGTGTGGTGAGGVPGTGGVSGAGGAACTIPPTAPVPSAGVTDAVDGDLITFNDNGAWNWFSDERAVVDPAGGKLIVSSVASGDGAGGSARDGQVEVTMYDLVAGTLQRSVLGTLAADDRNSGALLVRSPGHYLAGYAGHNQDCNSYFRSYDGSTWGAATTFDWTPFGCGNAANGKVTYSNLWNMTAEGKIYGFVRAVNVTQDMATIVSTDGGQSWSRGGQLSTLLSGDIYGYFKYWGNGVDRIDFVGTEAHPRDFDNSLYHGYIKGGKSYDSTDRMMDADITDAAAPMLTMFTKLFATGTVIHGVTLTHAWNIDLQRYDDGSIALLWTARADTNADDPDHRILYARFDGGSWTLTYLGKAGHKLYDSEQDYIGLGALHPNDPRTIYISTPIDPRDDTTDLGVHEIFRGTTCDHGATFTWTPVTQKSTHDNLRPIIPSWDSQHTALLWWRGTYTAAASYNAAVVGLIKP